MKHGTSQNALMSLLEKAVTLCRFIYKTEFQFCLTHLQILCYIEARSTNGL